MAWTRACLAAVLVVGMGAVAAGGQAEAVAREITAEATRANDSPDGLPLPLATHWCTGAHRNSEGLAPVHQMEWIAEGRHLLPWFQHPHPKRDLEEERLERFKAYYEQAIRRAAELKLPLCFKASQWEKFLSAEPYIDLPPEKNPNVVTPEGKIKRMVSPFGPVAPWREVGRMHTDNPALKLLQEWYPDPPLVVFLSNNEHRKLRWHQMELSQRYQEKYGEGRDGDFKRKVVGDGWIVRYRALQEGMRDGLTRQAWRKNAIFVGYGGFGPQHMGRWGGWPAYSLHTEGRISPTPLMWDGASPSYYTHDWNPSTDYTVWSPQVQFQNLVFMKRAAWELNPRFWVEMSVWDGNHPKAVREKARKEKKRKKLAVPELYRLKGQEYTPTRYRGFVQFGMWLLRPRAVREFRGWTYPSEESIPYFKALCDGVDLVYENAALREWWRKGRLVPNGAHEHLYQAGIPEEWQDEDRWFLLDANVNPQQYPWEIFWEIRVFALALVRGQKPAREWLVYAHAPVQARRGVRLTIPDHGEVTVDVAVGGSFYQVDEQTGEVTAVE